VALGRHNYVQEERLSPPLLHLPARPMPRLDAMLHEGRGRHQITPLQTQFRKSSITLNKKNKRELLKEPNSSYATGAK
jgi:hypothetical protein